MTESIDTRAVTQEETATPFENVVLISIIRDIFGKTELLIENKSQNN